MPALSPNEIAQAILDAIHDSGFSGALISSARTHPRRFAVSGPAGDNFILSVYVWTLTFGGRPSLPNEWRIQMTSVKSPLTLAADGPTVLVGYDPDLQLIAGFDLLRHRTFTTGSPSVQIDREALKQAETDGLSFHRKTNEEIAIGVRPDQFVAYALNAEALHKSGSSATLVNVLNAAVKQQPLPVDIDSLSANRKRLVQEVSRLSRSASFGRNVLFAYGQRCAVTRVQLKLVDAAHILPVGAPGSSDDVRNGIALSPTFHRAYDAGLVYLDEQFRMLINPARVEHLTTLNLISGIDSFKAMLGKIFLPPDAHQRPAIEFIKKANRFRQITA